MMVVIWAINMEFSISDRGSKPHSHIWSYYNGSQKSWHAYKYTGENFTIIDWGTGMDGVGTGFYPLSVASSAPTINNYYYTDKVRATPPYVQLLYCEKV